jgi:hypothetical protein
MVEILDAYDVQSQVPELFHQSPEFWIVSHRRNNARVAIARRLDMEVIDEAGQHAPTLAAEADPVLPGAGSRPDHRTSHAAIRGPDVGRLGGPRDVGATDAGCSAAVAGSGHYQDQSGAEDLSTVT